MKGPLFITYMPISVPDSVLSGSRKLAIVVPILLLLLILALFLSFSFFCCRKRLVKHKEKAKTFGGVIVDR